MRELLLLWVLLGASGSACANERGGPPQWLVGHWCTAPGDEQICDDWSASGDALIGSSTTTKDGKPSGGERMRIAKVEGALNFFATVDGAPEVAFPAIAEGAQEVTFANPAHDYPQRIRFWREGERLRAEISLSDGSEAMGWTYERADR